MSVEVTVPTLGESIVEATVGRWLKQEGEEVGLGDPLVELETEKVNMEVPATADGVLQSITKQEGETVGIGDVLAVIGEAASSAASDGKAAREESPRPEPKPAPATPAAAPIEADDDGDGTGRATPLARRIAAEQGVDISQIRGTGPAGRVRRDDVAAYLESRPPSERAAPQAEPQAPVPVRPAAEPAGLTAPASVFRDERPVERMRMSRRRQTIARRLVEAQHTAAILTTFNEIDMSGVMDLRGRRRDEFKEVHGIGLGFMSFFTKASIGALKVYPRLNAEIDGNDIVLKRYYDIGIAVGAEEGLVVPVIRDADRLTFAEIEQQVADLAQKVRERKVSLEELQGGTFTISNGGIYGSLLSTPILNTPQVGVLGLHKIEERPIASNGEVVIRPMMYVALSYDHRIVDGSEAVRFLVRVKELIEDPERLLLEG